MSCGLPIRPSGVISRMAWMAGPTRKTRSVIGVSISAAAIELKRTFAWPYSTAAIFVAYSTPAFALA